ncbi:MAG: hypothetical protein ACJAYG_002545 [Oceanicoccus sp.]|jgi:hypothetical protein
MKNNSKSITAKIAFNAALSLKEIYGERVRFRATAFEAPEAMEAAFPGMQMKGDAANCAVKVGNRSVYLTVIEFFGGGLPKLCIYSQDLEIQYTEHYSQAKLNTAIDRISEIIAIIENQKLAA